MTPTSPDQLPFTDERVTAYLDDELSPAERATFEVDLERDPALRSELAALTEAAAFLSTNAPLTAPPDLLDGILAATAEEKVVRLAWYRRPFGIPLEGLAVAAAALLVVYVALPGGPSDGPPADVAAGRAAPTTVDGDARVGAVDAQTAEVPAAGRKADEDEVVSDGVAAVDLTDERPEEASTWKGREAERRAKEEEAKKRSLAEGVDDFELPKGGTADEKPDPSVSPDAEQTTGKAAAPLFSQVPYSYSIATRDPAVLSQLAALAARYSGELKNSETLVMEELSGSDAATVMVKIPAHALRDFGRSLEGLGSVQAIADNSMFAGDPVEVRVSVQLIGGQGTPGPAQKKKGPKMMQQAPMSEAL